MIQDEKVWVRDKSEREIDRQRKRYIQRERGRGRERERERYIYMYRERERKREEKVGRWGKKETEKKTSRLSYFLREHI